MFPRPSVVLDIAHHDDDAIDRCLRLADGKFVNVNARGGIGYCHAPCVYFKVAVN